MDFLEKFEKLNNRLTNLLEENKELNQQCKNLQEENKNLKHVLNLEKQKNEQLEIISQNLEVYKRKYENLQEENKNLNEKEKNLQQYIQNLEKQKNEQLEIFSQNLEKTLGKLELDKLDKVNENDTNYNDDSIDYIEDSSAKEVPKKGSTSTLPSTKKELVSSQVKSSWNLHGGGNIRVVVGLDFGTTYSGFSYVHVSNSNRHIHTNDMWPESLGNFKTNTVLQYDDENEKVVSWGLPALAKMPKRRRNETSKRPVELFKMHLGNLSSNLKPHLPNGLDYKKAITDYLREIGKLIKETISNWKIDFYESVLLVLTVPTEYSEKDKAIMRKCVYEAGLIKDIHSGRLQFTTEPEAAAIYCMENLSRGYDLLTTGTTFMIVDCGGGTIDITIRKLIENNQLGEVTESTGDFCGSTFIDKEFVNFLRKILGNSAIDLLITNNYGQFQYMIQEFCQRVKLLFTGNREDYDYYELDIEITAPDLLKYVNEETRYIMEENDWIIKINYEDIKAMFDLVVDRIIKLIHSQLSNAQEECSAMFLVGGFSESKYLQKRIREEFQHRVKTISIPIHPIAAISRGAVMYGSSFNFSSNDNFDNFHYVISSRILKYTYGIKVRNYWMEGDPIERKIRDGRIDRFHCLARRGVQVDINEEFTTFFTPLSPMQSSYCDEPGMKLLGKLTIYLSGSSQLDKLLFGFSFGQMEFAVTVKNEASGQYFRTKFEIDV